MASIYSIRGIYYLTVCRNYTRKTVCLHTRDKKEAKKKARIQKNRLENSLLKPKKAVYKPFSILVDLYIQYPGHPWKEKTRSDNSCRLKKFLKNRILPENISSAHSYKLTINSCINWGIENGYSTDQKKFSNVGNAPSRLRVYNQEELKIITNDFVGGFKDNKFTRFLEFAYQTGARSKEIRNYKNYNLVGGNLIVPTKKTKSNPLGKRVVILNKRATELLDDYLYTKDYVGKRFHSEALRYDILDARFHDLRRTFGYNLLSQGMSLFKVSKLLGHSNTDTTYRHYAPLLVTDVEEFSL
jgi:integrase